jgi:hypothetical protein
MSLDGAQAGLPRSVSVGAAVRAYAQSGRPDSDLQSHGDLRHRKRPLEEVGDRLNVGSRAAPRDHCFPTTPSQLRESCRWPRLVSDGARAAPRVGHHRPMADASSLRLPEQQRERLLPPRRPRVGRGYAHLRRRLPRLQRNTSNASTRPAARGIDQARPALTRRARWAQGCRSPASRSTSRAGRRRLRADPRRDSARR